MMKHRKILALLLAAALSVSLLASAAMAADTDAQSQATQKTDAADAVKEKPQTGAAGDSEAKTAGRSRRGCKREQVAEPEGAIGKDRAKELALADAGLSAEQTGKVRSRLSDADGTVVYKVRFTCDGQRYSYQIDALSGKILDSSTAAAEEGRTKGGRGKRAAAEAEA